MKKNPNLFARKKLLALAVPMLMFGQAQAVEFEFGEASLTVDSQLSIGSSWRMEKQNDNLLDYKGISAAAGNTLDGNTSNDGNLNYEKGDAFSQIFKGNHDLQLTYQNFGAFVRFKYWYDAAIEDNKVEHGHGPTLTQTDAPNQYGIPYAAVNPALPNVPMPVNQVEYAGKSKLDDSDFNDLSKGKGATILDAFIYGSFDIGEMPLDVRLGRQVVSWGESTFISGGVNSINPVDVAAFRRPGAEIKEGLLPVNMLYANLGLTDSVSLEAFYQLEFQETVLDGCGTYFSTGDLAASEGCDDLTFFNTSLHTDLLSYQRLEGDDGLRRASDDGQFGLAVRYFSDALDTEFGFYAMNIHSRLPFYGVKSVGSLNDLLFTSQNSAFLPLDVSNSSGWFVEYPEDIKLVGMSFAGNAYGMAVSGEISHKMDAPVAINGTMVTGAALAQGNTVTDVNDPDYNADRLAAYNDLWDGVTLGDGKDVHAFRLFDITQIQATAIHLENRLLGASSMAFILEAGMTYVHDLDDLHRYQKSSIYQAPSYDGDPDFDGGFVTETSWGYRAVVSAKYTNVFAGVDLSPSVNFTHDVDGYAPSNSGGFAEDVKTLSLSLKANYLQRYDASIAYKAFMGGDFNPVKDRDFLAISAGVQF